jgi:UDP-glucose 6-dehydrogenase
LPSSSSNENEEELLKELNSLSLTQFKIKINKIEEFINFIKGKLIAIIYL